MKLESSLVKSRETLSEERELPDKGAKTQFDSRASREAVKERVWVASHGESKRSGEEDGACVKLGAEEGQEEGRDEGGSEGGEDGSAEGTLEGMEEGGEEGEEDGRGEGAVDSVGAPEGAT